MNKRNIMSSTSEDFSLIDDDFSSILICAVRYALGRQTYMPQVVVEYITPLIPKLSNKNLQIIKTDVLQQKRNECLGDKSIDKPIWEQFLKNLEQEIDKRKL